MSTFVELLPPIDPTRCSVCCDPPTQVLVAAREVTDAGDQTRRYVGELVPYCDRHAPPGSQRLDAEEIRFSLADLEVDAPTIVDKAGV